MRCGLENSVYVEPSDARASLVVPGHSEWETPADTHWFVPPTGDPPIAGRLRRVHVAPIEDVLRLRRDRFGERSGRIREIPPAPPERVPVRSLRSEAWVRPLVIGRRSL